MTKALWEVTSQSLSGWGGVFNPMFTVPMLLISYKSQSLSGWGGVFNWRKGRICVSGFFFRRNPFQGGVWFSTLGIIRAGLMRMPMSQSLSGWGGVFNRQFTCAQACPGASRNPFQGGVGFSTSGGGYHYRC